MKFLLDAAYGWPASFSQERLFYLDQLAPDTPSCSIPVALQLSGAVDAAALEAAFAAVVAKHEALRTTLAFDGDAVYCTTRHALPGPFLELARLDSASLAELTQEILSRPFDLAAGPLFRFVLVQQDAQEARLLMAFHHAIFDAWSMEILAADLETAYAAALRGGDGELAPGAFDYADFAGWQREQWHAAGGQARLNALAASFAGAPEQQPLPADRPRPATMPMGGDQLALKLPAGLERQLGRFLQAEGDSLPVVFSSLVGLFLAAGSGRDEIVIGMPATGRTSADSHEIVGPFANMLALRLPVGDKPDLREMMRRVRDAASRGCENQDIPFGKLVDAAAPDRASPAHPLLQVAARVEKRPRWRLAGLRLDEQAAHAGTARLDLSFILDQRDDGLWLALEYATSLFDASTVRRLWSELVDLAEACLANPSARLDTFAEQMARIGRWPDAGAAQATARQAAFQPIAGGDAARDALIGILSAALGGKLPDGAVGFIRQGGTSLAALRVIAACRQRLSLTIPLRELIESATLGDFVDAACARLGDAAVPDRAHVDARLGQLSSNQQSLYFFEKLAPNRALYNVPLHLEMRGELDPARLEAALGRLLNRHEALRTRFVETPSGLRQEVGAPPARALETADLSQQAPDSRDAGFAILEQAFSSTTFDLAAGRLFRFCLVRRAPEHWVLLMVFHHMVFDGHSAQIWLRDLQTLLRGDELPDAGPALTVREAAAREQAWQDSRDYQIELERWHGRFDGKPTPLNLRPDRPRPMRRDYAGAFLECALPQAQLGEHIRQAAQLGASPFMAVAALLAGYLSSRGNQADVCLGFPHGGRGDDAIEETIGNFVNLLAMPVRVEPSDTPRRLIEKIRQVARASYAGYRVPFSAVVERLGIERVPGLHPVFQAVVTADEDFAGWTQDGLVVTPAPGSSPIAKFDLAFGFNLARSCVRIEYATDMFDPASIERMGAELSAWLSRFALDFDSPLRQPSNAPAAAEVPRAGPKLLRKPKRAQTGDAGLSTDAT
ncbi:condensation domain-containing protein [Chromobacterium vaccinii]|uniref:condensation domain-containing protein n=1 Tax=Chromobacterium vaccinii TaxID=1108595 RepID=UPI003C786C85